MQVALSYSEDLKTALFATDTDHVISMTSHIIEWDHFDFFGTGEY